jgi:hypothetical protein
MKTLLIALLGMVPRPEGNDREQFRLKMLGADQADLTFIPSEEMLEEMKEAGIGIPKPIRLRKIR